MNIKELVLVISILLSIRIADYAMKKYKEQKDVEVTKKQKSRKQTKKYIITAPSILKVGLPCGIFFGCTTIAFILSQIFKWEFVQQIENCYFMLICLLVSIGFTVLGIVLTLYGYIWKIEYDTQEIIYRSALGITRKYRIEDITRCVGKRRNQYRFYQGEKKIFQYEMDAEGDVYDLLIILKKRGIDEEERALHSRANDYPENIAYHRFLHLYFFYNCIIFDSRWENLDVSVAGSDRFTVALLQRCLLV